MDDFARRKQVDVLSLPTGQGMIVKPGGQPTHHLVCAVCGGRSFKDHPILWPRLIAEWQLSPEEARYIDRQQGTQCRTCQANLRSIALAEAIRAWARTQLTLRDWITTDAAKACAILEVNEAGTLSPCLRALPGHVLAEYPNVDITNLPYPDGIFDLVVHSDTLEHVSEPRRGLAECRRVLRAQGALCFTVPIIVGRMSRSRAGLPRSYHGTVEAGSDDLVVHTEFGADAWTYVMEAGFSAVSIHATDYPSATAMLARR